MQDMFVLREELARDRDDPLAHKRMNDDDTLKGQWLQLQGKVRQQWGRLTHDDVA